MTKKKKEVPEVEDILSETPSQELLGQDTHHGDILMGMEKPFAAVDGAAPSQVVEVTVPEAPVKQKDPGMVDQSMLMGVSDGDVTVPHKDFNNHNPEIVDMPTQEEQPTEEMQNAPVQVVTVFRCVKAMDQMGLGTNIVMALKASPDYQTSVRPGSVGNLSISTVSPGFNGWFEEGRLYRVEITPME